MCWCVVKGLRVTYTTLISTCRNTDLQNYQQNIQYIMFIFALILLLIFDYHALYSI